MGKNRSMFNRLSLSLINFLKIYQSIVDFQCCIRYQFQVYRNVSYLYIHVCVCVCIHSFTFFHHVGHYRVLSRVPCALEQVLIIYKVLCICQLQSPDLPSAPHITYLLVTISFCFYICSSISVLQVTLFVAFYFSTYK